MSIGKDIAGIRPGARMWSGVVTSLVPFEVDGQPVAPPAYAALVGDRVQVMSMDGWSVCQRWLPEHALPVQVTVTATSVSGKPGYLAASGNGRTWQLPYTGSVAVGDKLSPDWNSSLGRVDAPPSPPPEPPPPPTPPAPEPTPITYYRRKFRAVQAGSWHYGTWDRSRVRQHRWSSEDINYGAWCYGGEIRQAVKGGTIIGAKIFLPRVQGGVFAAQTAHLYSHGSDRLPGGDVSRVGPVRDVTVSMGGAWYPIATALATAAMGGGIAIAGAPYVVFAGLQSDPRSGQLDIQWRTGG
ncbi:hypothetical protein [Cumulibacter soli]|uniref:hypothetical protein n=1 Tax=Cumulibacter soli TaxID=2546344 RepID=UPI0010682635|nr:hypothetical protein [Cumulibacter soli]